VDRREGKEEEGICRTNVKVLHTPLHSAVSDIKKATPATRPKSPNIEQH